MTDRNKIPRSADDDYSTEIVEERQRFIEAQTGASLDHTKRFSFDPHEMESNIENFWGVAQIPIGVAGPLLVNGEHAQGEFYVPMATVEGTMLASYNRGMKVIRECGGVLTTVSEESMQRSPVFIFRNARQARDFQLWIKDNFDAIKAKAETDRSLRGRGGGRGRGVLLRVGACGDVRLRAWLCGNQPVCRVPSSTTR